MSRENWPVRGWKNWQFFGLQICVKFVIFQVLSYIGYQNNHKFNNPSVWYTWLHSHRERICIALFWTLSSSIFPQHSSYLKKVTPLQEYSINNDPLLICAPTRSELTLVRFHRKLTALWQKNLDSECKTFSSGTNAHFDLWCINILTKRKTFSANNFFSGTVYTF